jgi:glycosyltransferase involved in cell wall biosynthesis
MSTLGIFTVKRLCQYDGHYYTYGGFGEYLSAISRRFDRVLLVAHVRDAQPPQGHYLLNNSNVEVVRLPDVKTELDVLATLPVVMARAWKVAGRIDIAHARMPNYTGVVGAAVCRLRSVPVFCQIIDDWFLAARNMPIFKRGGLGAVMKIHLYLYDFLERLVCRKQLVFAQGETCYAKHRLAGDRNLVLSSSHHLQDVVAAWRDRFQRQPFTILNVARLTSAKNQRLLLIALVELCRSAPWRLVFVGDGPNRRDLQQLSDELGIRNIVTFAGQVTRGSDLWRYFDDADVFALPSRSEGTPKVLLEAMARGLPIVAANVSGVPTAVGHEERGLLFPDNDAQSLVTALERIATNRDIRQRCVANGIEFAKEHTVEAATQRMLLRVSQHWPSVDMRWK